MNLGDGFRIHVVHVARHTKQMERSDITYSFMFNKVKRELAKKKGIIL